MSGPDREGPLSPSLLNKWQYPVAVAGNTNFFVRAAPLAVLLLLLLLLLSMVDQHPTDVSPDRAGDIVDYAHLRHKGQAWLLVRHEVILCRLSSDLAPRSRKNNAGITRCACKYLSLIHI